MCQAKQLIIKYSFIYISFQSLLYKRSQSEEK